MKLTRVMAGEYRCDITGIGTYHIWDEGPGGWWIAKFSPGYQISHDIGRFGTLREARKACQNHSIIEIFKFLNKVVEKR